MKISLDNYQEWALDYIEGNLGREERASFESFMAGHADIAREIGSLQACMPVIPVEHIVYPGKKALLRGGRTISLNRIGSFLGGAAAASLLIGAFTLVNNHTSQKEQLLADRAKEVFQEELPGEQQDSEWAATENATAEPETATPQLAAVVPQKTVPDNRVPQPAATAPAKSAENRFQPVPVQSLSSIMDSELQLLGPETTEPTVIASLKAVSEAPVAPAREAQPYGNENTEPKQINLRSLFAPFDPLIPIKTYRTENEHGIEIASILRIGNKIQKTEDHD